MPSWTSDQQLAIDTRGGKIIVSAAAGSGKTAVLSQRVIELILSGTNVDELLIVTFTKAAAEEMKIRIKDKIENAYLKDPSNSYLKKQLILVPNASITTMDAFYSELVKNNFEKLNIKKNFGILSSEEESILKNKVMNIVLEQSFDMFDNYCECLLFFGANNTSLISDIILKVSSFLDTLPFADDFIKEIKEKYLKNGVFYKELMLKQIKEKMNSFKEAYDDIIYELSLENECFDKVLQIAKQEQNYINDFLKINNFNELSSRIRTINFDTLRTPKGHKDDSLIVKYKVIRDDFKNEIKKNLNELAFVTDETYEKENTIALKNITTLFEITNYYRKQLLKEKKKINKFSFGDISHFVIELLVQDKKKTKLAIDLSKRYKEILIDEYQDTNNLQNVIFNAISNDNKNLFIVGDVKQSIYRFRSACPEIFNNDKALAFKDKFPRLITLSKNFRSRKEVLDFCNFIFENTMSNSFGEVNYDENERLYLGASFEESNDLDTEVLIIDGKEKNENEEDEFTKVQKEAILVADKIKSLLNSNYQVYDNKNNCFRNIKPSDIVILLRSLKNSNTFKEALLKRNISVYLESSLEYFDNYEIKLIINILKFIDNSYDDVSLLSILNSSLLNVSLDEIASLRANNYKKSLYDVIKNSSDDKIRFFLNKIIEIKNFSYNHLLSETLSLIYKEFDVINILSSLQGGLNREKNLIQMINHACNFEKDDKKSLHEFINYLENVILNKDSLEGVNPLSEGDNVLITTIHKSKGLEYPVVILSETGKKFNFKDVQSDIMINEDLGFCCNIRNNKYKLKYESIPIMVFKNAEKSKMLSEELRILYVALTRAKEKIIITGFTPNLTNLVVKSSSKIGDKKLISNLYLNGVKSYLDIILPCLVRHVSGKELRDLSVVAPKTFASESKIKIDIKNAVDIDESEFLKNTKKEIAKLDNDWLNEVLEFKYDRFNIDIPRYLSVSDIKSKESYLKNPDFLTGGVSATNKGTLYHKILELLSIKKYSIKQLEEELLNMVNDKKISEEERKTINLDKIFAYLTSDIYDMLLKSDSVYKEFPIDFKIPASYYDKSLKSGNILTSGVIDLLFIKDGIYYIIDYKTDNVNDLSELKERYHVQLDLYELAIKEIMNAKKVKKFIYSIKLNKFIEI